MGNTECCSTSNNTDGRELKKEGKKHGKGKSIKNIQAGMHDEVAYKSPVIESKMDENAVRPISQSNSDQ